MEPASPQLEEAWFQMAELFLDNEVRPSVPIAALACVNAGLDPAATRRAWRFEITPALWVNLKVVAGEWSGWSRPEVLRRVQSARRRWWNRPGLLGNSLYRLRMAMVGAEGLALERCVGWLLQQPGAQRAQQAADLSLLAQVYFDPSPVQAPGSPRRSSLLALFSAQEASLLAPLVVRDPKGGETQALCRERVLRWLGEGPPL